MLATTSSTAMTILSSQSDLLSSLQANNLLFRQILNKIESLPLSFPESDPNYSPSVNSNMSPPSVPNKEALIHIPSHLQSGLIHIFLLDPPSTLEEEEAVLQEIVEECLNTSQVLVTRARRLRGQETFEPEPSLKVCMSSKFSRKEVERAAQGLRQAIIKVCASTCRNDSD